MQQHNNPILIQPTGEMPRQAGIIGAGTIGPFFVLNMSNGNPIIIETNTLQAELEGSHYLPAGIFQEAIDRGHGTGRAESSR